MSSGHDTPKKSSGDTPKVRPHGKERDMGVALRSVYQKAVEEAVPDEMLDLLGKLD